MAEFTNAQAFLQHGLPPLSQRVDKALLNDLVRAYEVWERNRPAGQEPPGMATELVAFLLNIVETEREFIANLHLRHAEFTQRCVHAATEAEKRQHILDYAKELGATPGQLRRDKRAFGRWFGDDAMADRYTRRVAQAERKMAFALGRLAVAAAEAIEMEGADVGYDRCWRGLKIEQAVRRLLAYDGDRRVCLAAFQCLARALRTLPPEQREQCTEEGTVQYVFRSALESRQNVWIQCEALSLLQHTAPASLDDALENRLGSPRSGDDLFVRRHAVRLLGEHMHDRPRLAGLAEKALTDSSPFVRQALASALCNAPEPLALSGLRRLALEDDVPAVRAAALLALPEIAAERPGLLDGALDVLTTCLREENDAFVLRTACKVAVDGFVRLQQADRTGAAGTWYAEILPDIERVHREAQAIPARRWAAHARESLWCLHDPKARQLKDNLERSVRHTRSGRRGRIPARSIKDADPATFARVLAVVCQEDFGLDVEPGLLQTRFTRGGRTAFRWWRWLHEVFHPSPEKRQAFPHTVGRTFRGRLHVPSGIMAELSETKVPGEPLHIEAEAGWRPYLPLVDELLSSLRGASSRKPLRIVTAEGVTEIAPPRFGLSRTVAALRLTLGFRRYAGLRNWHEDHAHSPSAYIHALERLGFRIQFHPHASDEGHPLEDAAVRRFFATRKAGAFVGLPVLAQDLWPRMREYFFSVYENSLFELTVFGCSVAAIFFGRILYISRVMRRTRAALPLVMGGWGTRGKSGTERLKAAMLNAFGCGVFSKTTGCEPTFLHGHAFGPLREILLFRPYEKASIWEQYNVTRLARRFGVDAFLWECMALTPAFVHILQRQWMRDDITTITNTYPDHEDLQGPAGVNVAEVMTNFIPKAGLLLTSEEQMRPILCEAADRLGTDVRTVGWLEAGLVAPDVLARFPYEAHPYNVALVTAVGRELGIPEDVALKEMADRVVPDIGVLKAYPAAPVHGRRLEFVNGMSANERYGCMNNWRRMGFADTSPVESPEVWLTTLVNNRADRVARSRMFAHILVHDVAADGHYVIGDNLTGLMGYIEEAWEEYEDEVTLWPASSASDDPAHAADRLARRFRMPRNGGDIQLRLAAIIAGLPGRADADTMAALWDAPDQLAAALAEAGLQEYAQAVAGHLAHWRAFASEYETITRNVAGGQVSRSAVDKAFRKLLRRWFKAKFVVIEDPHVAGDAVVNRIVDETPPGLHNRIMGLQNIKGAGLNFVYCWQAWDRCRRACTQLMSTNPGEANQGLRELAAFRDYGVLCEEHVRHTVDRVVHEPKAQTERFQAELTVIRSNLDIALREVRARLRAVRRTGGLVRFIEALETFLDAGDAIRRRKMADRVYTDLVNERISHERAARELLAVQHREKGGWLLAAIIRLRQRMTGDDAPEQTPGA